MHQGAARGRLLGWVGLFGLVLSLWKLRVGVEAYYLSQVASGLDDYYTGSGEAVGEWAGSAAEAATSP